MLIRKKQLEELRLTATRSFEQRMMLHLTKHFPAVAKRHTQEQIRMAIGQGVQAARTYGFMSERHVAKYIDLIVGVGLVFDSQFYCSSAKEALSRTDLDGAAALEVLLNAM